MNAWPRASYTERRLLISAAALVGMAESLARLPYYARVAKRSYAMAVARKAGEVQHWAANVALSAEGDGE